MTPDAPKQSKHDGSSEAASVGHVRVKSAGGRGFWLLLVVGILGFGLWKSRALFLGPAVDLIGWRTDSAAAFSEAAQTGRPVLIDFTAAWCGGCVMLEHETFSDPGIAQMIRDRFVPLRVDVDEQASAALVMRYRVEVLPLLVIARPDGRAIGHSVGFRDVDDMRQWLNAQPVSPSPSPANAPVQVPAEVPGQVPSAHPPGGIGRMTAL